jgi:hypothetical protein
MKENRFQFMVASPTLSNAGRWTQVAALHSMVYPAHRTLRSVTTCNLSSSSQEILKERELRKVEEWIDKTAPRSDVIT